MTIIIGTQWGNEGKERFSHFYALGKTAVIQTTSEQNIVEKKETDKVIGIVKAYATKTDEKPFPTEQENEIGEIIRRIGNEYDPVTGKPRRCGWMDLVLLKKAIQENKITELAISHIDTIGRIGMETKTIKVCTVYSKRNVFTKTAPDNLEGCQPYYETFYGGWEMKKCRRWEDVPGRAKRFIDQIEKYVGVPIKYLGVGPKDKHTIIRPCSTIEEKS